jgi:maleylacetoacetate isomerase
VIRLYGFWRSQATFRVRAALNLKGLAYEETMLDLDAGEQLTPQHLARNPQGAVPVLSIDDGPGLTQSMAILEYLEERFPKPPLLPADALGRARVRSLALLFAADHHPLVVPRVRKYLAEVLHLDDAQRAAWGQHWLREGLKAAEARLAVEPETGRYCHGEALSFADLCLTHHVLAARSARVEMAAFPTVSRIAEACLAVDAIARAQPLRQAGAPGRAA